MRRLLTQEVLRRIEETGLTPFAFAKSFGFTPESLRRWLNGDRNPRIQYIQQLSQALRCRVSDISELVIVIDHDKISRKNAIIDEIEALSVYLTQAEMQAILVFVRSLADTKRETE